MELVRDSVVRMVAALREVFPHLPVEVVEARCREEGKVERATERLLREGAQDPQGQDMARAREERVRVWVAGRRRDLETVFPTTCPDYLATRLEALVKAGRVTKGLEDRYQALVEELGTKAGVRPTRRDWEEKEELRREVARWAAISPEELLAAIPDPEAHFTSPGRAAALPSSYQAAARAALLAAFPRQAATEVELAMAAAGTYLAAVRKLRCMEDTRGEGEVRRGVLTSLKQEHRRDLEVEKERRFLEVEEEVQSLRREVEKKRKNRVEVAEVAGRLVECQCCYSDECLQEEMVVCPGGHSYCGECVARAASVAAGEGKTGVVCLGGCDLDLRHEELRRVVAAELLDKLALRRQAKEGEEAGLENLETCPACHFAVIMEGEEDRVVVCRNPRCGRLTCRKCREVSHLPAACGAARDEAERARKEVEEQLTRALVRQCHRCRKEFIRTAGCLVMTCPCGASQCYICHTPLTRHACPNHCRDDGNDLVHGAALAHAAATARATLAQAGVTLAVDPLAGLAPVGKNLGQVRAELLASWTAVSTRARALRGEDARRRLLAKLDTVLKLIQGDTVVTAEQLIRGHIKKLAAAGAGEVPAAQDAGTGAGAGAAGAGAGAVGVGAGAGAAGYTG